MHKSELCVTFIRWWVFLAEISGLLSGLEKKGTLTTRLKKGFYLMCCLPFQALTFRSSVVSFTGTPIIEKKKRIKKVTV